LRKVAGAFRTQLIFQFLSESTAIAVAALVIAIALVAAFLPFFDDLTGKSLSDTLFDPQLLIGIVLITLITGLLSGTYPAIFLSRFVPVKVLKGDLATAGAGSIFRNAMVVIQFSISITLLVGTAVVFQQMQFISNRNLGYDKENLLYVPIRGNLGDDIERLRTLLKGNPATSNFSIVSQLPTNLANGTVNVQWDGKDENTQPLFPNMAVDENFVDVFKMTMLNGRTFSRDIKGDSANYLVNEEALKVMNMTPDDAVGKALSLFGVKGVIIGVVKNFNFKPVQSAIEPMIMQLNRGFGSIVVRTQPGQTEATVAALEDICETLNPQYPFSYAFVDEDFEKMYRSEHRLGKLFGIFTVLGIVISCLGLYGLSAFLTERRTKEIGVRKVLGASVLGTTWLLSRNLIRPVVIATLIATPLAWYMMDRWLASFVYRVTVGWEIFTIAIGVSLLVVVLTVSGETIKAALANPSRSLRSE
jgi:ABC-type antimicrobial peptide transport system permease subunit